MLLSVLMTQAVGNFLPWKKNPLSPILVAIILSLIIRNIVPLPQSFNAGIAFGVKKLLRFGIILMGIRLSIFSVLEISLLALGMVVLCIVSALVTTMFIARKIGVSERLGTLIAAGTSICGVSAIVATSPVINAKEEETAYAVGTITIFGILATIAYPYLTELVLHLPVTSAGFFSWYFRPRHITGNSCITDIRSTLVTKSCERTNGRRYIHHNQTCAQYIHDSRDPVSGFLVWEEEC